LEEQPIIPDSSNSMIGRLFVLDLISSNNQPDKWPADHTAEFMDGYNDGFSTCSGSSNDGGAGSGGDGGAGDRGGGNDGGGGSGGDDGGNKGGGSSGGGSSGGSSSGGE